MHTSTGLYDKFISLKNDYKLMQDYWMKGVKDDHFEQMSKKIGRGLADLLFELNIIEMNTKNSLLIESIGRKVRSKGIDWSWDSIRRRLEAYVTNFALAGLDVETMKDRQQTDLGRAKEKKRTMNNEHNEFRKELFDYIVSSRMLSSGDAESVKDVLLSPTVDSVDQQLIVSAFTLNALRSFDFNKFKLLTEVYKNSADVFVRQRALVGWVLTLGYRIYEIYPDEKKIVDELIADEAVRKELVELQMQLYYCINAEKDSAALSKVMPDMMQGSGFKITENGIEDMDRSSSLDEILGKSDTESKLERIEAGYKKIQDMYKSGSDIYFGGFSMMKQYPFFNEVCNWFMPFYKQHPMLEGLEEGKPEMKLAYNLTMSNPFCDSDKYSFVLTMKTVFNRIPANLLEMMQSQELPKEVIKSIEDEREPMNVRRNYLQCMFRFFKLYKYKSSFVSPFETKVLGRYSKISHKSNFLFFENGIFSGSKLEDSFMPVMQFFMKRQPAEYEYACAVFDNYEEMPNCYDAYMLYACLFDKEKKIGYRNLNTIDAFKKALELRPDSKTAKRSLARAYFKQAKYEQACVLYGELLDLEPNNVVLQVCKGACLTNMKRNDEALKLLFKCDFENPDTAIVMRTLGRTLISAGRIKQADEIFDKVLKRPDSDYSDKRYSVMCKWILRSDMNYVVDGLVKMIPHFSAELYDLVGVSGKMTYSHFWQVFDLLIEWEYRGILFDNGISHSEIELVRGITFKKYLESEENS